ncbi:MAG: GGDEF domain-containing protein [Dehalococcoidia bacterium]
MTPRESSEAYVSLGVADRRKIEQRALGLQLILAFGFGIAGFTGLVRLDGTYGHVAAGIVVVSQVPVSWYVLTYRLRGRRLPIPDLSVPFIGVATITLAWTATADSFAPTWACYLLALTAFSRRVFGRSWAVLVGWTLANAAAGVAYFAVRDDGGPTAGHGVEVVIYVLAMGALANMLSSAWRRAEQIARDQAARDALTGLPNRRATLARLEALCERPRMELAVIMVDLDDFKRVNDLRGHGAGDEALVLVGQLLQGAVRSEDLVGRYGGEEFLIVLPRADLHASLAVAERLRSAVEAAGLVTVSVGVALREFMEPPEALIERADKQLLRAKREGKNRVCVAPLHRREAA